MRFASLVTALSGLAGLAWGVKDDNKEKSPDGEDIKSIAVSLRCESWRGRTEKREIFEPGVTNTCI